MIDDTTREETTEIKKHAAASKVAEYISNPFTTAFAGIEKMIEANSNALVGVVIVAIIGMFILVLTLAAIALAGGAFTLRHTNLIDPTQLPAQLTSIMQNMSDANIISTFVLGMIIILGLGTLLHVLAIMLAILSSQEKHINFNELLKRSWGRILPALGLTLLIAAIVIVAVIILGLLAQVLGLITFVLAIGAAVSFIYCIFRFLFSPLAVVDGKNPIASLRYSWQLTEGHVSETAGILGAGAIIIGAPIAFFNMLSAILSEPISTILSILLILAAAAASVFLYATLAERYTQFTNLKAGLAKPTPLDGLNYVTLIIYFLLLMLMAALTPQSNLAQPTSPIEQYFQQFQMQQQNNSPGTNIQNQNSAPTPGYNLN